MMHEGFENLAQLSNRTLTVSLQYSPNYLNNSYYKLRTLANENRESLTEIRATEISNLTKKELAIRISNKFERIMEPNDQNRKLARRLAQVLNCMSQVINNSSVTQYRRNVSVIVRIWGDPRDLTADYAKQKLHTISN